MERNLPGEFRGAFLRKAQEPAFQDSLKSASLAGKLGLWTTALTACVYETCKEIGMRASAKGHAADLLPIQRSEYLALDVMAFAPGARRWLFPSIVMELENSAREDQIAYSLWKVLRVRCEMRMVFCYRKEPSEIPMLIQHLKQEVVEAMELSGRVRMDGRTVVVVGSRNDADTFPFGFFSWWELDYNTGRFIKN